MFTQRKKPILFKDSKTVQLCPFLLSKEGERLDSWSMVKIRRRLVSPVCVQFQAKSHSSCHSTWILWIASILTLVTKEEILQAFLSVRLEKNDKKFLGPMKSFRKAWEDFEVVLLSFLSQTSSFSESTFLRFTLLLTQESKGDLHSNPSSLLEDPGICSTTGLSTPFRSFHEPPVVSLQVCCFSSLFIFTTSRSLWFSVVLFWRDSWETKISTKMVLQREE